MKNYTVFITDDDADDYLILTSIFHNLNLMHQFRHLKDGEQLISNLLEIVNTKQPLPDIIILDYNMPKMNGLEALIEIRKHTALSLIPVIVYSTSSDPELENVLLKRGATSYVTKSSSLEKAVEFALAIDSYLRGLKDIPGRSVDKHMPETLSS